ncbi:MAG: 2OG-Fe(II) oxygenase [Chromatiales bacterium]|nr:2OG-Fe(II) oxygenase [Chromatiales bacterium]
MQPALPLPADTLPLAVVDDLVDHGYSLRPGYFDPALVAALRRELRLLHREDRLRAARIGKDGERQLREDIRGDQIRWLTGETDAQQAFLAQMEALRETLNRELFLGLEDFEAHFALYPPGAHYERHLDSFNNNNLRRVTIVAYLNARWRPWDGGELNLYDGDRVFESIRPEGGTLVTFLSERIPHEVAVTQRSRLSIAGWFRVRPLPQTPPL